MVFVPHLFKRLCLTLIHKTKQNGLKRVILRVMEAQDIVLDSSPYWTPKKTLYESRWNPNHHVWDALKWRASATLNVKTHNHHASHDDCFARSTPFGVATSNRLRRLGSRFQMNLRNGFGIWTYRTPQGTHVRILKLIVSLYGLIHSVIAARNILKNFATKNISNVLYYPRSMISDICLIRCGSCGESKSIFQPWNLDKYLCMDCFNFYGPVAQLDKASVYGTEDYRFDSYRVRQN